MVPRAAATASLRIFGLVLVLLAAPSLGFKSAARPTHFLAGHRTNVKTSSAAGPSSGEVAGSGKSAPPATDPATAPVQPVRGRRRSRTLSRNAPQEIAIDVLHPTRGGFIVDARSRIADEETVHTLTLGFDTMKGVADAAGKEDVSPKALVAAILKLLHRRGTKLTNTEGVLGAMQFPVNYFSARVVW